MNGTAVACAQMLGIPTLPMMTCGDPISLPACFSAINFTNTLSVGMTFTDFVIGYVNIFASILTDVIISKLHLEKLGLENTLETIFGNSLKGLSPVSIVCGLFTSALTGDATFKISPGLPFLGGTYSYTPFP